MTDREKIARAIWAVRPDCYRKVWPIETAEQRRAYPHNPIAAVDLCYIYADAALAALTPEKDAPTLLTPQDEVIARLREMGAIPPEPDAAFPPEKKD